MLRNGEPITGRDVLVMLLGLFGLVVAVNGVFIYFAVTSFSGLETENAYVKGLAYNETLRAADAQRALGWTVELSHRPVDGGLEDVAVSFRDEGGNPVENLAVDAVLRRPVDDGFDRNIALEPLGAGRYGAAFALPLRGQWDVHLKATAPDGTAYRLERRLWLN